MRSIIIKPVITEKAVGLSSINKYVFMVNKKATKNEIKKEVAKIFKVKVKEVNIINQKSKQVRRGRMIGEVPGYKKAVVTLKEGEKIKELEVK